MDEHSEQQQDWKRLRERIVGLSKESIRKSYYPELQQRLREFEESEAKYRSLVEDVSDLIWEIDEEARFTYVSPRIRDFLGYEPDELLGKTPFTLMSYEEARRVSEFLTPLLETHQSFPSFENTLLRKDGGEVVFEVTARPILDAESGFHGYRGANRDITERRNAEKALRESQRTHSTLMSNLPGMAYRCVNDVHWTMMFVSDGSLELTGYPPEALMGNSVVAYADLIHPEDRSKVWDDVQAALAEKRPFRTSYRIVTASGDEKWVWEQGRGIYSDAGRLLALEGLMIDDTERKHAEESLIFANAVLQTQQDTSIDGILIVDGRGNIVSFNQQFVNMWGIPADILAAKSDDRAIQAVLGRLVNPEEFVTKVRYLYEHPNEKSYDEIELIGDIIFERYSAPMLRPDGYCYGRVWYFRDISDRKRADEALKAERRALQDYLNQLTTLTGKIAPDGTVLSANAIGVKLANKPLEELVGRKFWDTPWWEHSKELQERLKEALKDAASGKTVSFEASHPTPTGGFMLVDFSLTPVLGEDNQVLYLVAEGRDITARKHAEEALKASTQRLSDIIDFLPDATMVIDIEGRIIAWNRATEELTGVKAEDILGKGNHEHAIPYYGERRPMLIDVVLQPEEAKRIYSILEMEGDTLTAEAYTPAIRSGGVYLWGKASPLRDVRGNVIGAIESIRDITERKRTEEALKESEEKFRALTENAEAIIIVVQDSRFAYANPYLSRLTGYSDSELKEMDVSRVIHPDSQYLVLDRLQRRLIGEPVPWHYEFKLADKAGNEIWIDYSAAKFDYRGRPAIVGVGYDITHRKKAEEEKKAFYRETILSATDGKLHISDRAGVDAYVTDTQVEIGVHTASQLGAARSDIWSFGWEHCLTGDRLDTFMIGVGEAIDNSLKHAGEGKVYAGADTNRVWVTVVDHGPGIESLIFPSAVLRRGFSTKPSLGLGYSIILQVADQILLSTGESGTTVVLVKNINEEAKPLIDSLPDTWEGIPDLT